jgi:predicted thioesterase
MKASLQPGVSRVSRGTHTRFVVDVAKTIARLKAKAAERVLR